MRVLFSLFFFCLGLLFGAPLSTAAETPPSADRYFDARTAEGYHAKMKAEMAQLVRLTVKGSNRSEEHTSELQSR